MGDIIHKYIHCCMFFNIEYTIWGFYIYILVYLSNIVSFICQVISRKTAFQAKALSLNTFIIFVAIYVYIYYEINVTSMC